MCNKFIEDFVNRVIEKNSLWLWVYGDPGEDVNFLLIEANSRREAILKIREYKYVCHLFHPNFDINTGNDDSYVERFELELYYDREMNFKLVDLSKVDRI